MVENITVLGSGSIGCISAADFASRGFDVVLSDLPQFERSLKPIKELGGINVSGVAAEREGFVKLDKVTTNVKEAMEGREVIWISVPAFAVSKFAEFYGPYLEDGQIVFTIGKGADSLLFAKALRDLGIEKNIIICETQRPFFAARKVKPDEVYVFTRFTTLTVDSVFAVFPAKKTDKIIGIIKEIVNCEMRPLTDPLQCMLYDHNTFTHPAKCTLNAGRIEWGAAHGTPFFMYREGVTPGVINVCRAIAEEQRALCKFFGYKPPLSFDEHDEQERKDKLSGSWISETDRNHFLKMMPPEPQSLKHRFFTEDVGWGLVTMNLLGDVYGVSTPTMKAINHLVSILTGVDWDEEGRTLEKLGIAGMTADELKKYLYEGE